MDHEGRQRGIARILDDQAERRGVSIRGLEKIGTGTGAATVVSAIDRQLDIDAGADLRHLGGILGFHEGADRGEGRDGCGIHLVRKKG